MLCVYSLKKFSQPKKLNEAEGVRVLIMISVTVVGNTDVERTVRSLVDNALYTSVYTLVDVTVALVTLVTACVVVGY